MAESYSIDLIVWISQITNDPSYVNTLGAMFFWRCVRIKSEAVGSLAEGSRFLQKLFLERTQSNSRLLLFETNDLGTKA